MTSAFLDLAAGCETLSRFFYSHQLAKWGESDMAARRSLPPAPYPKSARISVAAENLARLASTATRAEVTVLPGRGMAVVDGGKAIDAIDAAGCVRDPSYAGWLIRLDDLPRIRSVCATRGWSLVVHTARRST